MGLRINTNIASLNAQRNLANITQRIGVHMRRLSTGLRITTAADDPAGLAMSERMRARIRSLEQGRRNALDGVSMLQTGEGALTEVSSMLVRLRELAVQSRNGTMSSNDRQTLQGEFDELVQEIDRIAKSTEFNGIKLLDGTAGTQSLQVGAGVDPNSQIDVTFGDSQSSVLGLDTLDITDPANIATAMTTIDGAIDSVSSLRGSLGAAMNRLDSSIRFTGIQIENLAAANSRIRDVDVARETAELVKAQILQQATIAVLAQANQAPQLALQLITGVR